MLLRARHATRQLDARWASDRRDDGDLLASELRGVVRGEVRFDAGSRALYATDASNYRQVPIGVVIPRDADALVEAMAVCRRYAAPVLGRGGGTSLAGQCCNVAVVFDTSKYMNQVLAIDSDRRVARVQPGTVLDTLQQQARPFGLIFGPDPSTHSHCALGGMIGSDSCGAHSVMSQFYGAGVRTSDNLEALEVLTYDGTRLHVGPTDDAALDWSIGVGGRRGEIYQGLLSLRDRYADLIRQRFSKIPRIVPSTRRPCRACKTPTLQQPSISIGARMASPAAGRWRANRRTNWDAQI